MAGDDPPALRARPLETVMRLRTRAFLLGFGLVSVGLIADLSGQPLQAIPWDLTALDWLFVLSVTVFVAYVLVPLIANPSLTMTYWAELTENRLAMASLAYLVFLFLAGTLGPLIIGFQPSELLRGFQPPVLTTVPASVPPSCVGPVVDGACHGSLQHPLGTNGQGQDMLQMVIAGSRVALEVAFVASMLMVPIGTGVGIVAGFRGGLVDQLLMRYVDVQSVIPAFLVYLVLIFVFGRSLFLVVVVFGLFSWGGVARLVRSEVLQRREAPYVQAARTAGAGRLYIIRRVLLPNISSTILTEVTRKASFLILIEAALAFMELSESGTGSWGELISDGMGQFFPMTWWISTVPVVALTLTVVAFSVLGDALRDVLDPAR